MDYALNALRFVLVYEALNQAFFSEADGEFWQRSEQATAARSPHRGFQTGAPGFRVGSGKVCAWCSFREKCTGRV